MSAATAATSVEAPPDTADAAAPPTTGPGWWATVLPGLVTGALAAVIGLDRSSLWRDEAYSLGAVHQLGPTLRETRGTMGAYYLLLRAWTVVDDSAWWMRSLSVLLALAGLVVVVRLVARIADARVARWTGVLLGLSLLWVAYAQEARSYALVLLLTATSWTALDRALTAPDGPARRRWVALHVATGVLLPLGQGLAVLQVAAQPAALGLARAGRRSWLLVAPGAAASVLVTGVLTALGTGEAGTWIVPVDADQLRALVESLTSDIPIAALGLVVLAGAGALVAVRTAGRAGTDVERIRALAPLAWAAVPPVLLLAISLVGRPTLVPRYVMASAAGVAVLWALVLARMGRRWALAGVPVLGALVVAVLLVGQVRLHDAVGDDWRSAAQAVAAEAEPGDVVLLGTAEVRPPFEAAWVELDDPPSLEVVNGDRPLGRVVRVEEQLPDAAAREAALDHDRVWVVGEARDPLRDEAVDALRAAGYRSAGTWAAAGGVPAELLIRR